MKRAHRALVRIDDNEKIVMNIYYEATFTINENWVIDGYYYVNFEGERVRVVKTHQEWRFAK